MQGFTHIMNEIRLFPAGIYLLKVNKRNTRTKCEICSKLTIKTPEQCQWRRSGVFIVNFEHIAHLALVCLLLTLNMWFSFKILRGKKVKRNTVQNIPSNEASIEYDFSKIKNSARVHSVKLAKMFNKYVSEAKFKQGKLKTHWDFIASFKDLKGYM